MLSTENGTRKCSTYWSRDRIPMDNGGRRGGFRIVTSSWSQQQALQQVFSSCWPDSQLTPMPRVTNTNSKLPFISCSLCIKHYAECFKFLTYFICITHFTSVAVEKASESWESNLRLSDLGDVCFLPPAWVLCPRLLASAQLAPGA